MSRPDTEPVVEFLHVLSPEAWVSAAVENIDLLLVDHANCEKKAASTAIGMTYRYVEHTPLLQTMSRLAREELRHFEQVVDLMTQLNVPYRQLSAARYASTLHGLVRSKEPERLVDCLILGAVVEARSCERFIALLPHIPEPIRKLYAALVNSEARHYQDYLSMAKDYAEGVDLTARVEQFLVMDAELICSPDKEFRFHSGVPG
ncbi:MAG: tRNA-(ms[2]io[6]A)-hydroxylase [Pseudomonadota bacterium]